MGAVALFVLLLGLLLPLLEIIEQSYRWRAVPLLSLALLLGGGIKVALAIKQEAPTSKQPLHSHVGYYLNKDKHTAYWASAYQATDNWNKQFFSNSSVGPLQEVYPQAGRIYLKSQAAVADLPAPVAEVLRDSMVAGERLLQLRLFSPRSASHMEIVLQPEPTESILSASLNNEPLHLQPIQTDTGPVYYIRYDGLPVSKDGLLSLHLKPGSKLKLLLYDHTIGLPQQLIKNPMPASVIPEQGPNSNVTVVRKTYTF
jgi:hypothetical protein